MKRIVSIVLACLLTAICFSVFASAADNETAYLKVTSADGTGGYILTLNLDTLEVGKTYIISGDYKFEGIVPNGGLAFINVYPYDAAGALGAWGDWASSSVDGTDTDWLSGSREFEVTEDFSYMTIAFGYWQATGTLCVDNLKVADTDGNIIFFEDFEDGALDEAFAETAAFATMDYINVKAVEEPSSEEPAASEEPASEDTASEKPAQTADNGIVAFAVIAALAVAGAVIVKKTR